MLVYKTLAFNITNSCLYITVHLWIMQYPKIKHIVFHDAVHYIYI